VEILLDRDVRSTHSTLGKIYVNGVFECFSLEDEDRGLNSSMNTSEIIEKKIKGETCIPAGRYQVIINFSNRFQRELPLLLNVPGYEGIRIHPGNTDADTEGCILTGEARQSDRVVNSRIAFEKLMKRLVMARDCDEKIFITVKS
jgi:hypothetical protein